MSVRIYHGEYSVSKQRKFVLVIGCYVRDVLGEDDMTPNADTNLRSDEVRVVAMKRLLKGKARVITANKTGPQHLDFMYHYKMNTGRTGWEKRFNEWLEQHHGGVLTDVYLDYFFFIQNWYRLSFGQNWAWTPHAFRFTGSIYLPIPQDPTGAPLDKVDHDYHESLQKYFYHKRGVYLRGKQLDRVPWCKATMNVHDKLVAVDRRNHSLEPPARNHRHQAHFRIEGILRMTSAQARNTGNRARGKRRQYSWKTVNKRRDVVPLAALDTPAPTPATPVTPAPTPAAPVTPAPPPAAPVAPAPTPTVRPRSASLDTEERRRSKRRRLPPRSTSTPTTPSEAQGGHDPEVVEALLQTPMLAATPAPVPTPPSNVVTAASATAPTPSARALVVKVKHQGKSRSLSVRVVVHAGRFQIRLPKALSGVRRGDITFRKTSPFGLEDDFGEFLFAHLRRVVTPWMTSAVLFRTPAGVDIRRRPLLFRRRRDCVAAIAGGSTTTACATSATSTSTDAGVTSTATAGATTAALAPVGRKSVGSTDTRVEKSRERLSTSASGTASGIIMSRV